ncbi:MAG: hypothetical protein SGBAC_005744 [Bacillariaceae sp.]
MTKLRSRQQHGSAEATARRGDKPKTALNKIPPTYRSVRTPSRIGDRKNQVFDLKVFLRYVWIGMPFIFLWLGCLYYVRQSAGIQSTKVVEIEQLLRRRGNEAHGRAGGKVARSQIQNSRPDIAGKQKKNMGASVGQTTNADGGDNEIIDMREWTRTLPFANSDGVDFSSDPGWLKTFDEYYRSQTKHILDTIMESLQQDSRRKFIWAEVSFFEKWWNEQSANIQDTVRTLLRSKQFEFVTGGWVQPDEANTDLYAIEIQLQEGHDFIRETFGEEYIPKYGWSIDPFGFSPTMAYLLKKYGFKGMLIQRVHYAIKKELALHRQLEFLWRQTWDNEGEYDIFTHMMPFFSYDVPHSCGPDPEVCCAFDFARLPNVGVDVDGVAYTKECPWELQVKPIHQRNVAKRAMVLLDQYQKKAALFRSNVVIAPIGDDFRYRTLAEAQAQFENYQLIFDYLNSNVPGVSIQFGTLSEYFDAVIGTFDPPILKGSFFTYADHIEDYWSGYFTSRPFDKALGRRLERTLFAADTMGATKEEMREARRSMSLFQHHDAITGTATDNVMEDYAVRMQNAIQDVEQWMVKKLAAEHSHMDKMQPCWQSTSRRGMDVNLCNESDKVLLFNPLETKQLCGDVSVKGLSVGMGRLPCEHPGLLPNSFIQFDPLTGLMTHPVKEQWMVWSVKEGGAYLFVPGSLHDYEGMDIQIEMDGFVVKTKNWRRTVIERTVPISFGSTATVIEFVYETNLRADEEEWLVRFTANIQNDGIFHTDLNGFNFDTHYHRPDLPIQAQVFPMPTHASIQDSQRRLTVLSDHSQGAASLEDGMIDVWLDRRLSQGDGRGLEQGVQDNVWTRSRLRVLVETDGYELEQKEFDITPLCKQMWKELNHPLEVFGSVKDGMKSFGSTRFHNEFEPSILDPAHARSVYKYEIPIVFMVQKRVEYFKRVIDSLQQSDYPRDTVPIIISHDGHVQEMVDFVESIRSDFQVIQLFHPFSCIEHQHSFPGDDPSLNKVYKGDSYGNLRDAHVCCLKHHFTWMINEVFALVGVKNADGFLFMEEDYIVAPSIYETLQTGFGFLDQDSRRDEYFGLTLDITDNFANKIPNKRNRWTTKRFVSGPMTIGRRMFDRLKLSSNKYCEFDDYNWDWSIVHLMGNGLLPYKTLVPNEPQVLHIGIDGGLHDHHENLELEEAMTNGLQPFHVKLSVDPSEVGRFMDFPKAHDQGYGGWGHPADHEHCKKLFHGHDPKPKQYFHL